MVDEKVNTLENKKEGIPWWIIVGIVVLVVVILIMFIVLCIYSKKKKGSVLIEKLPTKTPMDSPRATELSARSPNKSDLE